MLRTPPLLPLRRLLIAGAAAALLLPATASAGTLTREGDALVFRAAPGEANDISFNDESGEFVLTDSDANAVTIAADGCSRLEFDPVSRVRCTPSAATFRLEAGDGDDIIRTGIDWPASIATTLDGGPGNDRLDGGKGADTILGGDGDDTLKAVDGDDRVEGGAGRDTLEGGNGRDAVRGGEGDDTLNGDPGAGTSADVLDGGPGRDTLSEYEYNDGATSSQRPVKVTLDAGGADDGRPGEGDEVTGIEIVHLLVAAELVAAQEPVDFKVFHTNSAGSKLTGGPGADLLTGYDFDDTIVGGAGDDILVGAYGHDTITAGPGRDTVNADAVDGCNFLECRPIYGNDTVDVRDGEVDNVTCGPGTDRVVADAGDLIGPDCETVDRGAATTTPGGGTKTTTKTSAKKRTLSVTLPKRLTARALKRGTTLAVVAPGAGKLKLTLITGKRGKGTAVATGSGTARKAGAVKVKLKPRTAAQRRRARKGSFRLTVRFTPTKGKAISVTKAVKLR